MSAGEPTIRSIAAKAGVSRTTVSLALRNNSEIPQVTRDRIHKIAQDLGYRINPFVSTFMSQLKRSKTASRHVITIGYITQRDGTGRRWLQSQDWQEGNPKKIANQEIWLGALERARQLNYNLEPFHWDEPGMTPHRLSKVLHTRNVHALIIAPLHRTKGHLSLNWPHFTCVAVGYSLIKPKLNRVCFDVHANMFLAMRNLRQLGYRNIGLAMPREVDVRFDLHYSAAYLAYHQFHHIRKTVPLFVTRFSERGLVKWYKKYRSDAIITTESRVVKWLRDAGIDVPGEVGVVKLNRQPETLSLTGVDSNGRLVGAACVEMAEAQLIQNNRDIPSHPRLMLIAGTWCPGETVRKL